MDEILDKYSEDRSCVTQYRMGEMFVKGANPRDYRLAAKWYLQSARQGFVKSQRRIGTMYAMGYGLPKDYIKAYAWFMVAAAQHSSRARRNLGRIESRMTPGQIGLAKKLAQQYYETFVEPFKS